MANVVSNFLVLMWSLVLLAGLLATFVLSLSQRSNRSRIYVLSNVRVQPIIQPQPAPDARGNYNLRPLVQRVQYRDNNNS